MRINEPITQQEFIFPDDATLMSTTDFKGRITYANEAFVATSGFSREELMGQPHNLVRHPDMPKEAFADMWSTLQRGEPWTGLVKNRRKNGDHYWVRANAVPVMREGQRVGYISVRTKPSRDEVASAEILYRQYKDGGSESTRLHKGVLIHTRLRSIFSLPKVIGMKQRIRLNMALACISVLALSWIGGAILQALLAEIALFAMISWTLERQISTPLEQVYRDALDVATGKKRNVSAMDRIDEVGMTARTVSQLALMLRWLIDDVAQQVITVQTAASEIAQGNQDLSARTESAAASVQQTASSMSVMTDTVKANAVTAEHANALSSAACEAATQGGNAVTQVVSTMKGISTSSQRIADIIGVIDGIAFQTNILALNAAVEAARAGEQGRGFAVVAGEVRSLAHRSAQAAKEIKTLITASVESVRTGAGLVDDAGRTMEEIMTQVRRTSELIHEISSATTHQSSGIDQASLAIRHLDEVTQQNAALVEQSAAASASLRQQATRLVDAVSVFR